MVSSLFAPRSLGCALLALLTLTAGGCASRGVRRPQPPQPVLYGQGGYFDGSLTVDAVLAPFRLNDPAGPLDRTPPGPDEGEPIPVTRGGFADRTELESGSAFPRGLQDEGSFGVNTRSGAAGAPRRSAGAGSPGGAGALPRQVLTVTLRSHAAEPITLRVAEVRSAVGNFVPVPETFTLPPGGSQQLEAMRSSYPDSFDELELLVALRARGRTESQVLRLQRPTGVPPR